MANDPAVLAYTSGITGMYIHNITYFYKDIRKEVMANDPAVLVYTSGTTGMYIHNIT